MVPGRPWKAMGAGTASAVSMLVLLTSGCGGTSRGSRPGSSADASVLIELKAVRVAATSAGTGRPWDGEAPEPDDSGLLCTVLGLAAGAASGNPGVGVGATGLCDVVFGSEERQRERDPTAPDLYVQLTDGDTVRYETYAVKDTYHHVFDSTFVVPFDSVEGGLRLAVFDRDGTDHDDQLVGSVEL